MPKSSLGNRLNKLKLIIKYCDVERLGSNVFEVGVVELENLIFGFERYR